MLGAAHDVPMRSSLKEINGQALENICSQSRAQISQDAGVEELEAEYSPDEMKKAESKCSKRCSLGPDGLPAEFDTATLRVTGPLLMAIANQTPTQEPSSCAGRLVHFDSIHNKGDHDQPVIGDSSCSSTLTKRSCQKPTTCGSHPYSTTSSSSSKLACFSLSVGSERTLQP
ncbi:hypothetical protein BCR37DRAFT_388568 [Protomyces lactucae-debilis]|uniref:Uncharacterized protein n=1 Tax=Protomyces lactucae-debilis TaxID=2754530 RepID=A0A1Y2F4Z4_PROLT|nr:uncharacterized protein BCR37DRAFT_388568 [Protomyces lactucae-debilis]ORY78939.1 hypothetical protein BCR37DRAFT_388568 [Protomyces lactucae-debilis]